MQSSFYVNIGILYKDQFTENDVQIDVGLSDPEKNASDPCHWKNTTTIFYDILIYMSNCVYWNGLDWVNDGCKVNLIFEDLIRANLNLATKPTY